MISSDPVLKDTKLIAEAWDCDGLNQVGVAGRQLARAGQGGGVEKDGPWSAVAAGGTPTHTHYIVTHPHSHPPTHPHTQVGAFPHYGRWAEWNGHFRDTVRQFAKGTDGPWVGNLASVLCGSPHIYVAEPGENDWCVRLPAGDAVCAGLDGTTI